MLQIPYYEVDAFTSRQFGGNAAGVCLLERWLPDPVLQKIAAENNLSETAFVVPDGPGFQLRWFTPRVEIDLAGHPTLACAFVLFSEKSVPGNRIRFHSPSGDLEVKRTDDLLTLDFPARVPQEVAAPQSLVRGLRHTPEAVLKSRDYVAVFPTQNDVLELKPDFDALSELDALGVIATAPGEDCDFVSRFFAPAAGIPEDPVTGSAHCTLTPYWSERLKKPNLTARQVSRRGGELTCEQVGNRVLISGNAVIYLRGEIQLDEQSMES